MLLARFSKDDDDDDEKNFDNVFVKESASQVLMVESNKKTTFAEIVDFLMQTEKEKKF